MDGWMDGWIIISIIIIICTVLIFYLFITLHLYIVCFTDDSSEYVMVSADAGQTP